MFAEVKLIFKALQVSQFMYKLIIHLKKKGLHDIFLKCLSLPRMILYKHKYCTRFRPGLRFRNRRKEVRRLWFGLEESL